MVRLLLLDTEALNPMDAVREVKVEKLDDYYKFLNCDTFDIANRQVGNTRYDLFVDDEGLFKQNPRISAVIDSTQEPALVGNIIFAKHDASGETVGLTDVDIHNIKTISLLRSYRANKTDFALRVLIIKKQIKTPQIASYEVTGAYKKTRRIN